MLKHISQSSPDSLRIQGPSRSSSGLLHPVSSVKERNRKGGKCKITWVLQSPVSSPQASPKVDASDRPKQAQHLSTCRPVSRHLHIPFLKSPKKYLTLSSEWIINQEKSELKPIQVFPFMGYEYHLDSALVKPTQRYDSIFRI